MLAIYTLLLVRLLLFKLAFGIWPMPRHHAHSLNLVPFAGVDAADLDEPIFNYVAFFPLGAFVGVVFRRAAIVRSIVGMLAVSLFVEIAQFVLGVGIADITDLITNALGGASGLVLYRLLLRKVRRDRLDVVVIIGGYALIALAAIFVASLLARGVRYQ